MKGKRLLISLLVTTALVLGLTLPAAAEEEPVEPGIDPELVEAELGPGKSTIVDKKVTTPLLPPTVDVVISVDLTGSMLGELANLKSEIGSIITALAAEAADLNVGIVSHEDYPASYTSCNYTATYGSAASGDQAFRVDYAVGNDFTSANTSVQTMVLKSGEDWPESYARVMWESGHADNLMGYRDGAQKILVMFLDAVPHDCADGTPANSTGVDPGRNAAVGGGDDIDVEDDAIPAMTGDNITLLVIYSGAADDKPVWDAIAGATGGSAVQINGDGTVPGGISLTELILRLIEELTTDVWWEVTSCDPGLSVTLSPEKRLGVSGNTTVSFTETITVADNAPQCTTLDATVIFYANEYPEEGAVIGEQKISIKVKDVTPPEVECKESVNPHGNNIPGGKAKGKGQGVNPDGFYELIATDNVDPEPIILILYWDPEATDPDGNPGWWVALRDKDDPSQLFVLLSETVVKFTQAPGATPSYKKIGSTNGQADAVAWHITLPSEPVVLAVDDSGNMAWLPCFVPPPPK